MKRKTILVAIVLVLILSISNISLGFSINMNLDKTEKLKANDEVIFTLKFDEKIVGASFKINYDKENLKLLSSSSTNLSVAENNDKIACVYIDMENIGTDNLKIKFKIINDIKKDIKFELLEAKFISLNNEETYLQDDILGITKTIEIKSSGNTEINNDKEPNDNNEKDNTISNTIIPQTGVNSMILIIIILSIIFSIICLLKINKINKKYSEFEYINQIKNKKYKYIQKDT